MGEGRQPRRHAGTTTTQTHTYSTHEAAANHNGLWSCGWLVDGIYQAEAGSKVDLSRMKQIFIQLKNNPDPQAAPSASSNNSSAKA